MGFEEMADGPFVGRLVDLLAQAQVDAAAVDLEVVVGPELPAALADARWGPVVGSADLARLLPVRVAPDLQVGVPYLYVRSARSTPGQVRDLD